MILSVINCLVEIAGKTHFKTHINLASFLRHIGKQYSPVCDAPERGAPYHDMELFCLLRRISSKNRIEFENHTWSPKTFNWTHPNDNDG